MKSTERILILGANGYVGARIYYDLLKNFKIFGTYHSKRLSKKFIKLDITDKENVLKVINKINPSVIIHVANNSSAKWCESNKKSAKKLNQEATSYIVEAANQTNSKLIYISSFAAIEHVDTYGKTKFNSEKLIKKTRAGYLILRLSLILGFSPNIENDRPFNRILKNIDKKTPPIYDTSWRFKLTYLGHVTEVIKRVINEDDLWGKTVNIAVEDLKSKYDVAKDILRKFNIEPIQTNINDKTPINDADVSMFINLHIANNKYDLAIKEIIKEIESREKFKIK